MSDPNGVYGALVKAQEAFPAITRDRTVTVQTKAGGSYRFAYAPLDSIMAKVGPVLAQNGLAITQTFDVAESGGPLLVTTLAHADGSMIFGSLPLPVQLGASAQELGSLITYCRRYAIVAILGLATEEDDDANHASGNTVQARQGGSQNGTPPAEKVDDPHGLQQSRGDAAEPGPHTITATIQAVDAKEGTSKQGKPYTKHTIRTNSGDFSTFDSGSAELARAGIGCEASITYEQSKFGADLKGIEILALASSAPGGADLDADIPFMASEF